MTSYLPDDCIYYIIKYLQGYRSILFNCALVNRFWCRAAIPLLYADPFFKANLFFKSSKNIILTLIPCFSKTEILQLKNQLRFIGINNIDIKDEYEPLFEYPKYLKYYNSYNVDFTIFEWLKGFLCQRNKIHENYFCSIFHQSILNRCINIEQFIIDFNPLIKYNPNFNFPISNLIKLNSLTLDNLEDLDKEIAKEFLNDIAIHCLNLKEFKIFSKENVNISHPKTQEELCIIIQKQNNLEKFEIGQFLLNENIFLSLEFQKHSLISIIFSFTDFSNISFKNFMNLYNLNYLRFYGCIDTKPLDQYEILRFASFKLNELILNYNFWNENIEPTMIKYFGTSLHNLTINGKSITTPIIENISIYCLNLITLEMEISTNIDIIAIPHFKNLKVRKLCIKVFSFFRSDISETFMRLANNLTINVKEISFWIMYYETSLFKVFLEHCHNHLEKISLRIHCAQFLIESEFLKIIKIISNYIEKGNNNLKILNISRNIFVNDEELRLLDEIKAKGTSPYLTDDCIYCILRYLQEYRSTLFNYILVNRLWCRAAILLLYSNPFNIHHITNYSIILTLILCLNKDGLLQLKNQAKFIDINDEYKPLFKYPKYLKIYDYSKISYVIFKWLKNLLNPVAEIFRNFRLIFHQF
ncbi:hypothetical protein RclHR1_08650004 [Rhizophagus clarus]|uniref:Uncharacterized protein n=1 Tax=Rhizophagus clarus TaxID=94130 RepID=A0A2Z6S3X9_9GLOM|nr:hypothetical protein RclHR1_08650004 [Rhizophagus clarus]GES75696.1 hypothetical protein GLOIN_2v1791592 [Rhizophagus clarus]